jgi:hypothetical protein
MNEDEAQRMRERIRAGMGWTLCRCGHILECCADCNAWLVEHSPRIARSWRWYVDLVVFGGHRIAGQWATDEAEFLDRVAFGLPVAEPCRHCGHAREDHRGNGSCTHLQHANGPRCPCALFVPSERR